MASLLDAALSYAKLGWYIFPIAPGKKTPLTKHGVKDATVNADQICRWWEQYPTANIAVACGEISGIHVVDIDVDPQKNIDGMKSLAGLQASGKITPETVTQFTPRGGAHLFFQTDDPPANKNSFLPGIDIRSTGYYVLLPPSARSDGREYRWKTGSSPFEHGLAIFPAHFRFVDKPKDYTTPSPLSLPSMVGNSEIIERATAYLAECDPAIQGEGGHDKLLWAAVAMVQGFLFSDGQAYDLLIGEYNPRCIPPWDLSDPKDAKDFTRKITEARKLVSKHPHGWLLENMPDTAPPSNVCVDSLLKSANLPRPEPQQIWISKTIGDEEEIEKELEFLIRPPGLVGDICSWINSTSLRYQPLLTLAGVLAFCGALFGRKIKGFAESRTNLYCMGVAPPSAGKQHALTKIRVLCQECGCLNLIGGDDFASDASIESRLETNPSQLFLLDEIGHLLTASRSSRQSHMSKIIPLLMKLYSAASTSYAGREYAEQEKRRVLIQPCCCIYGTSTPEVFLKSVSTDSIRNGWLSRCLVFCVDKRPEKRHDLDNEIQIPANIIEAIKAWYARKIERDSKGDIDPYVNLNGEDVMAQVPSQLFVEATTEAAKVFVNFDKVTEKFASVDDNKAAKYLWPRGEESARKIALIIAAGEDLDAPVITQAIADYACRLVKYLIADFCDRLSDLAINTVHERKKKLLGIIKRAGAAGCMKTKLSRDTQELVAKERSALVADLLEAELIVCETKPRRTGGTTYWMPEHYLKQ